MGASATASLSAENARKSVFLSRAMSAILSLQQSLSAQSLELAVTASTDYMVLVNALCAAPMELEEASDGPLATASLRGLEMKRKLLIAGGGVVTSEQAGQLLGITRQAVDKRRAQNRLIGLKQGRRGYAYPRVQFVDHGTLPGLEAVLDVLGSDTSMQLLFLVNPNDRLGGRTPEKELLAGNLEKVLRAARMFGEQGAA